MNNFKKAVYFCMMIWLGGSDGPYFPWLNFVGIISFGALFINSIGEDTPYGS